MLLEFLFNNILVLLGIIVFIIAIILFILSRFLSKSIKEVTGIASSVNFVTLLVTVPKQKEEDKNQQDKIEELLSEVETWYANIGGMKSQKGVKSDFVGRDDHFCFEIVREKDGLISFYISVQQKMREFFEQQIHAKYPRAQITEVDDFNVFDSDGHISGAVLKLKNHQMFPLKTYKTLGSDPLDAITNSMSKLGEGESAVVQFVLRSARPGWHKAGSKVASDVQQGKSVSDAMSKYKEGFLKKTLVFIGEMFGKYGFSRGGEESSMKPGNDHRLSPMEEEAVKALEEKTSKAGFEVNIRVVVCGKNKASADSDLDNILNSFSQFTGYQYGNGFNVTKLSGKYFEKMIRKVIYRSFDDSQAFVLNTEEMISLYHFPLPTTETPNIRWLLFRKLPPPSELPREGVTLGKSIYRGEETDVRIKQEDRRRHMYIIGSTGVGKSVLMSNVAIQDVREGRGICVIDPHGDLVEDVLKGVPKERADDVIIFDPTDYERPLAMNMLEYDPEHPEQKIFAVNEVFAIFDKLYDLQATGGPMFEQYFKNAALLIMDDPASGSTLLEISRVLADEEFRKYKLSKCKTQVVKDFWEKEAQKAGGEASLQNMVPYITSKLSPFIANDLVRPIISQQKTSLDFREAMDSKKIVLVKLAKGKIGDINANLLGMIIVGKILMAALGRSDVPQEERKDFYLYIDEFQNFLTDSINVILSEARKYRLNLIIAHQYIGQLVKNNDTRIKDAIFGNVGSIASFRIGVDDAETIAKQLAPGVTEYDVMNIEKYNAYLRLLIDNQAARTFNIQTYPPYEEDNDIIEEVKKLSRLKYGRNKDEIEREINKRLSSVSPKAKEDIGLK